MNVWQGHVAVNLEMSSAKSLVLIPVAHTSAYVARDINCTLMVHAEVNKVSFRVS